MTYISNHTADVQIRNAKRQADAEALERYLAEGGKIKEVTGYQPKPLHSFRQGVEASWKDNGPLLEGRHAKQSVKRESERIEWHNRALYQRKMLSAGIQYKQLGDHIGMSKKKLYDLLTGVTIRPQKADVISIEAGINELIDKKK
jgi:hypothetical protein